jgi:hypothetical protein
LDLNEFKKLSVEAESDVTENDKIKALFENVEDPSDQCAKSNMVMKNNISNINSIDMGEDDDYTINF